MAKQKNIFLFRKKYEKWLLQNKVSEPSLNAYCIQTKYNDDNSSLTYFDVIGVLAYEHDIFFSKAIFEQWKRIIDNTTNSEKTKLNKQDYLEKYRQFFEKELLQKNARLSKEDKVQYQSIREKVKEIRSQIAKQTNLQIDGMDTLLGEIGTSKMISLAIESSYFFSIDLVKNRFDQISKYITSDNKIPKDPAFNNYDLPYLPARYTETDSQEQDDESGIAYFCIDGNRFCPIYQENYRGNKKNEKKKFGGGNGNARVCQLIKDKTGYDLGGTQDKKSFKNYIISHIWSNATDPRYFTNLWNVAIVPAWANHLLDKDETGTLAAVYKSIIQAIITKYYNLEEYDWNSIGMSCPEFVKASISGSNYSKEYKINVIEAKKDEEYYGKIKLEVVDISKL